MKVIYDAWEDKRSKGGDQKDNACKLLVLVSFNLIRKGTASTVTNI